MEIEFPLTMLIRSARPQFKMGQMASMFSTFSGDKWNFERVLEHSKKSAQELKESREYLIDVREANEISGSGAIPNAINIPLGSVDAALKFPKQFEQFCKGSRSFPDAEADKLIFSCQSGMRAGRAAAAAQGLGFEKVAVYPGSYSEWRAANKN